MLLTSCVDLSGPQVDFREYKIARITTEGIEVNFFFDVENKNPVQIDITKYNYKVYVEGKELLSENREGFSLAAHAKKLIKIPVLIRYDKLFGSVLAVVQRIAAGNDTISFSIDGSITGGTMGVTATTPIKAAGKIPLPKDIKL